MNKVFLTSFAAAILAVIPASASEVGLLFDKQFGESVSVPSGGTNIEFNAVKPNGFGIRGAYTVLDLKVADLGIAATYHPKAEDDLSNRYGVYPTSAKAANEYIAIGAQVEWKLLVDLHLGLDVRREKMSNDVFVQSVPGNIGGVTPSHATTFTRPWLKAGIGFSIPTPVLHPFFRLEAAYALKSNSLPALWSGDNFLKALAPKYQIGLYGGTRF